MDLTLYPRRLSGTVKAIPSKSQAHRLLICAAFADGPVKLNCPAVNDDIIATVDCLQALGASIRRTETGFFITPVSRVPDQAELDCKESGSTLRFMLPVAAALGVNATFKLSGRLPERPLSPLWEELTRMGCRLDRPLKNTINCAGQLQCGNYFIDGSISSQFITGLLFALALLPGESTLTITGNIESKPYIRMTEQALRLFDVDFDHAHFCNCRPFHSPGAVDVEGDWSNAAFFVAANALGSKIDIQGLQQHSAQGDRMITQLAAALNQNITIDGSDIPDLIPILSIIAGAKKGAHFKNIGRLRLKESDRIVATKEMLEALGAKADIAGDALTVYPAIYRGCNIDAKNDHRIAMAAAIASTVATGPVTITGAECVKKSYPDFWTDFVNLGGYYEQYIR